MAVSLFVAGDVVPAKRTKQLFQEKKTDSIFGTIIPEIKKSDVRIVNLECPIVYGNPSPINKNGPTLSATKETIEVLADVGVNVVTLANNHFLDQGDQGVFDTLSECRKHEIEYVGGGVNIDEAKKVLFVKRNNITISIINACEHEFSIANDVHGGSNPFDIIQMYDDILYARSHSDFVVLIIHGGIEHFPLPTPRMKKIYRHLIRIGADVVINHHQHCFSGYEIYKGKPIFYGLGNFCFDNIFEKEMPLWNRGYAVKLLFDKNIDFKLIPYEQCGVEPTIKVTETNEFEEEIQKLNNIIQDDTLLLKNFDDYLEKVTKYRLYAILPWKGWFIKKLFYHGLLPNFYNRSKSLTFKNQISCESHIEVLRRIFELRVGH